MIDVRRMLPSPIVWQHHESCRANEKAKPHEERRNGGNASSSAPSPGAAPAGAERDVASIAEPAENRGTSREAASLALPPAL